MSEITKIGSAEWIFWRRERITATDAAIILSISPYGKPIDLWAEKLGLKEPPPINEWMIRGQQLEGIARDKFEEETGLLVFPKTVQHKTIPYLAATLDGITLELDAMVEIKCNGPKNHALALKGELAPHHNAQMQHQMECVGLDFAYYYSFDGDKGVIVEVKRDQEFIDNMLEKEFDFWQCLQTFTPPLQNKKHTRKKSSL